MCNQLHINYFTKLVFETFTAEIGTNLGLNKLTSANYESLQAATEHVYDTVFRQLEQVSL